MKTFWTYEPRYFPSLASDGFKRLGVADNVDSAVASLRYFLAGVDIHADDVQIITFVRGDSIYLVIRLDTSLPVDLSELSDLFRIPLPHYAEGNHIDGSYPAG